MGHSINNPINMKSKTLNSIHEKQGKTPLGTGPRYYEHCGHPGLDRKLLYCKKTNKTPHTLFSPVPGGKILLSLVPGGGFSPAAAAPSPCPAATPLPSAPGGARAGPAQGRVMAPIPPCPGTVRAGRLALPRVGAYLPGRSSIPKPLLFSQPRGPQARCAEGAQGGMGALRAFCAGLPSEPQSTEMQFIYPKSFTLPSGDTM